MATLTTNCLLSLTGFLAICFLLCKKPLTMAVVMFLESLLLTLILGYNKGFNQGLLGGSTLLSFLALIILGVVLYFDRSFKITPLKTPKSNIIAGLIFFIMLIYNIKNITSLLEKHQQINQNPLELSYFTFIMVGFSLFSILFSAFIILQCKNHRTEE
jgi:hypothetical protein